MSELRAVGRHGDRDPLIRPLIDGQSRPGAAQAVEPPAGWQGGLDLSPDLAQVGLVVHGGQSVTKRSKSPVLRDPCPMVP